MDGKICWEVKETESTGYIDNTPEKVIGVPGKTTTSTKVVCISEAELREMFDKYRKVVAGIFDFSRKNSVEKAGEKVVSKPEGEKTESGEKERNGPSMIGNMPKVGNAF